MKRSPFAQAASRYQHPLRVPHHGYLTSLLDAKKLGLPSFSQTDAAEGERLADFLRCLVSLRCKGLSRWQPRPPPPSTIPACWSPICAREIHFHLSR